MAASGYPANLTTNAFILHDFAEIAYIVCTGATPASTNTSDGITSANSPEHTLARLKTAEKQFRQASILVALDPQRLELFTFYKKVDVVKDQRAILSKFGYVCRMNSCIIAYKNASRIIELVKPDSARVYKLFTDAIISSIQIIPATGQAIRPTKSRYILMRANDRRTYATSFPCDEPNVWCLYKLDVQIIPTGHVIITTRKTSSDGLYLVNDLAESQQQGKRSLLENKTLYLWPFGQPARYKSLYTVGDTNSQVPPSSKLGRKTIECWDRRIRLWLNETNHDLDKIQQLSVVEAEVPVRVAAHSGQNSTEMLQWVTVLWPAELTYAFTSSESSEHLEDDFDVKIDPLQSAEEWFLHSAPVFEKVMQKGADANAVNDHDVDGGRFFDDDFNFESPQHFVHQSTHQFATQNTVYPTPPEVPAAQPTPGMSVDGVANTPSTILPSSQNIQYHSPLANMQSYSDQIGTQQVITAPQKADEELLSRVVSQANTQNMVIDEPNWDFFDEPGFEVSFENDDNKQEDVVMEDVSNPAIDTDPKDTGSSQVVGITAGPAQPSPQQTIEDPPQEAGAVEEIGEKPNTEVIAARDDHEKMKNLEAEAASQGSATAATVESTITSPKEHENAQNTKGGLTPARDKRYSLGGKYWFVPNLTSHGGHQINSSSIVTNDTTRRDDSRSSTESLESDASDADSGIGYGQPWMYYQPSSQPPNGDIPSAAGDETIEDEVDAIFNAICNADADETVRTQVGRRNYLRPKMTRTLAIAQVLVEQLANSSVFQNWPCAGPPEQMLSLSFTVLFDNTELRSETSCASLSELISIQSPNSQAKLSSKMAKVDDGMIRIGRFNEELVANTSILQFWDILNLQPLSGDKNVLALCLHPAGPNYAHGTQSFLSRISESYAACNFGKHQPLEIPGMENPGLVSWSEDESSAQSLQRVCENIGTSLTSADVANDCILVYVVIPNDNLEKCFDICNSFFELFEAFRRGRRAMNGDVVLQMIPASFVVSAETIVIPPQRRFIDLAAEVYERVPPSRELPVAGTSSPHALVAKSSVTSFEFELSTKALSPLSRSDECCHLAYSISSDNCWLSAAWSDELGRISLSMSYCLKDPESGGKRSRLDVLRHICELTVQLMVNHRAKWLLCVAKVNFFETEELQEWLYLSSQLCDNNKNVKKVVLLSVELQPRLTLYPQKASKQPTSTGQIVSTAPNAPSTPVTTPQATTTTSPEQHVPITPTHATAMAHNSNTPPDASADGAFENDLMLHDPSDDVWLATLPFGLNQSLNFLEVRPALASGFLIKRAPFVDGAQVAAPSMIGVNLIATPKQSPSSLTLADREALLHDILTQFRNMYTLTTIRRSAHAQKSCVPWHVATAYRGANILEALM